MPYIRTPFANSGEKTAVPVATQPDGSVSYEIGFGADYSRPLSTDPLAKPVPRAQTNQLYFDITSAIKRLQEVGAPDYITPSDNGGSPFAYEINAIVRHDDKVWINTIAANTDDPDTAGWINISEFLTEFKANELHVDEITDKAGTGAPDFPNGLTDDGEQVRASNWMTYGGAADAITLTTAYGSTVPALKAGDQFRFRATANNTGATTINVDGLGAIAAITITGVALPAGYVRTDVDSVAVYNGTNFVVSNIYDGAIGWGRSWQDMSASRASGVTYTNDSGFEMPILVRPGSAATSALSVLVDSVEVWKTDPESSDLISASVTIPRGAEYSVFNFGATPAWFELR